MSDDDSNHRHRHGHTKLAAGKKDTIGNGTGASRGIPLSCLLWLLLVQQFGLQSIIEIDLGLWQ